MNKSSRRRMTKIVIAGIVGTLVLSSTILSAGCAKKNPDILTLKGDIQNNIVSSISTVTGKITVMNKNLGEPVKKGEIIASIDDKNQAFMVQQLEEAVRIKAAKLEEIKAGARPQAIKQLEAQVSAAKANYDLVLRNSELDPLAVPQEAVTIAKANYDAVSAQLALVKAGATTQALTIGLADLSIAISQLNQAKSILENHKIISLADGIIISKNYQLGDVVTASADIADIAIANDLYIIGYIPDEYLSKVKYNQKLNVNTPVGVIHGEVIYIAINNEYTPKDKQSINDINHKATKIKIKVPGINGTLRAGMTAEIEVPLK